MERQDIATTSASPIQTGTTETTKNDGHQAPAKSPQKASSNLRVSNATYRIIQAIISKTNSVARRREFIIRTRGTMETSIDNGDIPTQIRIPSCPLFVPQSDLSAEFCDKYQEISRLCSIGLARLMIHGYHNIITELSSDLELLYFEGEVALAKVDPLEKTKAMQLFHLQYHACLRRAARRFSNK